PAGKPLLTLLVDQSASMAVEDAPRSQSRWKAAVDLAARAENDLGSRFEGNTRTFSGASAPATAAELASAQPEGLSTNLGGAIAAALASDRPQGQALLVISDGIHNGAGGIAPLLEVLRTAKAMDVPIYTTTLGGDSTLRDLEISVARPQELAFVGQRVPIPVVLRQRGRLADRAEVVLLQDGKELARETQALPADGRASLRFHVAQN